MLPTTRHTKQEKKERDLLRRPLFFAHPALCSPPIFLFIYLFILAGKRRRVYGKEFGEKFARDTLERVYCFAVPVVGIR